MIVRKAEATDAEGLTELGTAVGSEPEGWLVTTNGWRNVSDERRYLRAIRRYPNAAVFVAEDEGLIVGRLSVARDQHPASRHVADLGLMVAASVGCIFAETLPQLIAARFLQALGGATGMVVSRAIASMRRLLSNGV